MTRNCLNVMRKLASMNKEAGPWGNFKNSLSGAWDSAKKAGKWAANEYGGRAVRAGMGAVDKALGGAEALGNWARNVGNETVGLARDVGEAYGNAANAFNRDFRLGLSGNAQNNNGMRGRVQNSSYKLTGGNAVRGNEGRILGNALYQTGRGIQRFGQKAEMFGHGLVGNLAGATGTAADYAAKAIAYPVNAINNGASSYWSNLSNAAAKEQM